MSLLPVADASYAELDAEEALIAWLIEQPYPIASAVARRAEIRTERRERQARGGRGESLFEVDGAGRGGR
ncbi:MAG: hypothetical protein IBX63_10885 [Coriobacteriia bacterium]|nr:hypothetical protein [Coriobacteriia bacterium]